MLHIRCGDDILPKLKDAGLPGMFVRWADPLCQGPTPLGLEGDAWRKMRAEYIGHAFQVSPEEALRFLVQQDNDLERFHGQDEVVLWFEHDLFDQIVLAYLLDWFSRQNLGSTKLSLICIDRFPGKPRFLGLGVLSAQELKSLFGSQKVVTKKQTSLACEAWAAFRSPDPSALEDLILKGDTNALPFLRAALVRHLHEFPSAQNGLGLTEQLALEAMAERITDPEEIFREVQDKERAPWLGDTMFWPTLRALALDPAPLVEIKGSGPWPLYGGPESNIRVKITKQGLRVVEGKDDWARIHGINRWLGGVHLTGREPVWRWDNNAGRLIKAK